MKWTSAERRKSERKLAGPAVITATIEDVSGVPHEIHVRTTDYSEDGLGIESPVPVREGSLVSLSGRFGPAASQANVTRPARVYWCIAVPDGSYRVGLCFERTSRSKSSACASEAAAKDPAAADYYEILQVSPKADPDTIHRVFRILAQRYHPDNLETGNEEQFKSLLAAYQVLIDPEKRAAYDVRQAAAHRERFRIFEDFDTTQGAEAEKRKRQGILSVLYAKRASQPEQPYLVVRELEELLNCPREHLEFSLWYLRENAWVARSDNGRYSITAKGVDRAERTMSFTKPRRLLPRAK